MFHRFPPLRLFCHALKSLPPSRCTALQRPHFSGRAHRCCEIVLHTHHRRAALATLFFLQQICFHSSSPDSFLLSSISHCSNCSPAKHGCLLLAHICCQLHHRHRTKILAVTLDHTCHQCPCCYPRRGHLAQAQLLRTACSIEYSLSLLFSRCGTTAHRFVVCGTVPRGGKRGRDLGASGSVGHFPQWIWRCSRGLFWTWRALCGPRSSRSQCPLVQPVLVKTLSFLAVLLTVLKIVLGCPRRLVPSSSQL